MPDIRLDVHVRLDVHENTPGALDANRAGYLATQQHEKLLRELEAAKRVYWSWPPLQPVWNGVISVFVFGWLMVVGLESGVLIGLMAFASALAALGYVGQALWQYLHPRLQHPALDRARERLEEKDYQIESWEGSVIFMINPVPMGIGPDRKQHYTDTWIIQTPMHQFSVSRALWEQFRDAAKNGLILYYLTEPLLTLLSIERIPIAEPPTDAELATVIGFGDDGELIYEEQDDHKSLHS